MSAEDYLVDYLAELTKIGYTEYEAKVYLALLRDYPATGYQISKRSSVPRSMVYETLSRLHKRGAVLETLEGRATLYRPLPPQHLLDRHESEIQHLVSDLRRGLEEIFTTEYDTRVWTIKGRGAVLSYAGQMIQDASKELFLVLTDEDLDSLRLNIHGVSDRNIKVRTLLTGDGTLDCGRVAYHPPLESELQELTSTLLVAVDNTEVLIASSVSHSETTATITRNPDLVLISRQFVWMELFAQRIYRQLGSEFIQQLDPEDQAIFKSMVLT